MNARAGLRWAIGLSGWMLAATACTGLTDPADKDLRSNVERFHHDVRWKYNEEAAGRVDPRLAADFRERLEDLKEDLNITGWEFRKVEATADGQQAFIRVEIEYFQMPSTVLQKAKIDQHWKFADKHWRLMSVTGGPFPLEAAPETAADGGPAAADESPPASPPAPAPVDAP